MPRQPLVHERVVRAKRSSRLRSSRTRLLKNSSVSRRIAAARLSSKFGIEVRIGMDLVEVLQPQPLRGEARAERLGARVGEHAARLLLERAGRRELVLRRRASAVPDRAACPRGRTRAATRGRRRRRGRSPPGRAPSRLLLEAEDEVRAGEDRLERRADAALEAALRRALLVERHQPIDLAAASADGGTPRRRGA